MKKKRKWTTKGKIGLTVIALLMILAVIGLFLLIRGMLSSSQSVQQTVRSYYEAKLGYLSEADEYRGIITRQEIVMYSTGKGIVEYYYPEGKHLSAGTLVCSLRDSYYGKMLSDKLDEIYRKLDREMEQEENEYYAKANEQLAQSLTDYVQSRARGEDVDLYTLKDQMASIIQERSGLFAVTSSEKIHALLEEQGVYQEELDKNSVHFSLDQAGTLMYSYDGYEGWSADQVGENFEQQYQSQYESISLSLEEIQEKEPLYRLITEDVWQISIFMEVENAMNYEVGDTIDLLADHELLSATVVSKTRTEKKYKLTLELTENMVDFASKRIVDVVITESDEEGCKIPCECVQYQDYYFVSQEYLFSSGSQEGLMIREEGQEDRFVAIDPVYRKAGNDGTLQIYFELPEGVEEGTVILAYGSTKTISLEQKEALPRCSVLTDEGVKVRVLEIDSEDGEYILTNSIQPAEKILYP